jgi:hypothetical protein
VFSSPLPSLALCRKELGEMKITAILGLIISETALSFNVGANMNPDQVSDTVDSILKDYWALKIDDFKLCFQNAKKERYGKIYRIDESVILSWLEKYVEERFASAENNNYNQHCSIKANEKQDVSFLDIIKKHEKR